MCIVVVVLCVLLSYVYLLYCVCIAVVMYISFTFRLKLVICKVTGNGNFICTFRQETNATHFHGSANTDGAHWS